MKNVAQWQKYDVRECTINISCRKQWIQVARISHNNFLKISTFSSNRNGVQVFNAPHNSNERDECNGTERADKIFFPLFQKQINMLKLRKRWHLARDARNCAYDLLTCLLKKAHTRGDRLLNQKIRCCGCDEQHRKNNGGAEQNFINTPFGRIDVA